MTKKLKKPSDYQQFSFRINEDDKIELNNRLDQLLAILKNNTKEGDYLPKKNGLILRAIKRGLTQIEKDISLK